MAGNKDPKPTPKAEPINKEAKITLITGEDVKLRRPGSKVAKLYDQYKNGMTVAQWLEKVKPLGGGMGNLRKDIKLGRIKISA